MLRKQCTKFKKSRSECRVSKLAEPKAKHTNPIGYTPPKCKVFQDLYIKCLTGKIVVRMGP